MMMMMMMMQQASLQSRTQPILRLRLNDIEGVSIGKWQWPRGLV